MKKRFLLGIGLLSLSVFSSIAQNEQTTPSESLDFTVNGITYTILNEQEKTCQTKAGNSFIDYNERKLIITYGNNIEGEVTIPATVTRSEDNTKYTVVAIGQYGFNKVSSIIIESGGVTTIREAAFSQNLLLSSISIPDDVVLIERNAFTSCTSLKSINLPPNITSIANNTFSYSGLTSIKIPQGVISVGEGAFSYCSNLETVIIPSSVLQLGKSAFQTCSKLSSLTIEEGISIIPSYAFAGCSSLKNLTIPASVTSIGDNGFQCSSLTTIACLAKTLPAISANSFSPLSYSNATLKVYKTVLSNYKNSQLWGKFENIEVIEVAPTSIEINPSTLNINVGLSKQLSAVVNPVDATGEVTWQLLSATPPNCIEIDSKGNLTSRQIGTGVVEASISQLTATCNVIVSPNPEESIVISPLPEDIYIGDKLTLSAAVFPSTIIPAIVWNSTNTDIAVIEPETGELTAVGVGGAVITATNDNVVGSVSLTVKPIEASSVSLNKENIILKPGETQTLIGTVLPENTTFKNISWDSNDPNIAVVSEGVVTAIGVGSANIRAMVGQVTANCAVTVEPIEAENIILTTTSANLKIGQSLQLSASVLPENTTDKSITWISDNVACATVSTDGEVLAVAEGSTVVTAECGKVSATCVITVSPIESEEIVLNYTALTLKIGNSQQLTATVYPENTTNKNVTWQTNSPEIATVENGLVTAISAGDATITVTNGNQSAICKLTVEPILVEQVILQESSITVNVGDTYVLSANILPENATDKTIQWESLNNDIVTVSGGIVKGIAPGSTTVIVSSGLGNASCSISVIQPAASIVLNENQLELFVGDTYDLIETVTPANTTDIVTWSSSNNSVATVNENGIISALTAGTTAIIASCGTKTAICEVVVSDISATSVLLDYSELSLILGQSHQLTATVIPDNTTFPIVVWSSSNTSVAKVTGDGTIEAVGAGTASIIAACGEVYGECVVNVKMPAPQEVILNFNAYSLKVSETIQLKVINPEGLNASEINWTVNDPTIATISAEGLVNAVKVGNAMVSAEYNGVTANCAITVVPTYAESVNINITDLTMKTGDTYQLTATVEPLTTTDTSIIWTSSNPDVAKVTDQGYLTAVSAGVATVTAECGNVYGICNVIVVTDTEMGIDDIELSENEIIRVYTLQGVNILNTTEKSDLKKLSPGLYIINRQKIMIR